MSKNRRPSRTYVGPDDLGGPFVLRPAANPAERIQRLQAGPATARELAALSLKYTSRVSDLRKAGYDVRCREEGGRSTYWLVKPRQEWHGHNVNEWGLR